MKKARQPNLKLGVENWLRRENVDESDWQGLIDDFLKQENYTGDQPYKFISDNFSQFVKFIFSNTTTE